MVQIEVNGETKQVKPGMHMAGLVEHLGLDVEKIAVEKNREIIPRSLLSEAHVNDGDKIEIIQFVGGG